MSSSVWLYEHILLFSLRPSTASDGVGVGQCELTELQTSAIRGLAGLFNASCNYNTSITEVLSD